MKSILFDELKSVHNHLCESIAILTPKFQIDMSFDNACTTTALIKMTARLLKVQYVQRCWVRERQKDVCVHQKIHNLSYSLVRELGLCAAAHDPTPKPLIHQQQELLSKRHFWETEQELSADTKQKWWCLTHSECICVTSSTIGYICSHGRQGFPYLWGEVRKLMLLLHTSVVK